MEGLAIASFIASVGSGVASAMEQKDAAREQKKAMRAETAMQQEQNRKSAMQTLREARIRSAMVAASAQNTGATGSGASGAMGSIRTMAGSSIGFQNMQAQTAKNISQFNQNAMNSQSRAATLGTASELFSKGTGFFSQGIFNRTPR
jgi:hypothetical protein